MKNWDVALYANEGKVMEGNVKLPVRTMQGAADAINGSHKSASANRIVDDTLSALMGYPIRGAIRRVIQIDPKNIKIMIEYTHY